MRELTQSEISANYETLMHIRVVQKFLSEACKELLDRAAKHDLSKLKDPEVSTFAEFTPKLKTAAFGSPEYKQFLVDMAPALENHYANNSHHPQHYTNGIDGMDLFDLLEMVLDWKASTLRTKDGDIFKSLDIQKERFNISNQLYNILNNTLVRFGSKLE